MNKSNENSQREDNREPLLPQSSSGSLNAFSEEEIESDFNSNEETLFTNTDVTNNNHDETKEDNNCEHKIRDDNSYADFVCKNGDAAKSAIEPLKQNITCPNNNYPKKIPKYLSLLQSFVPKNPVYQVFVTDFLGRLFGKGHNDKKRVRFADTSAVAPETNRFWIIDGKCIPIPIAVEKPLVPYGCKITITDSDYVIGCCVKYRDKKDFKHELEVVVRPSFTEKLKEFSKVKELIQNFIRFEYWSTVQHIIKTVDFKQREREEDEIGPIATKMWMYTFILDDMFQDRDLPEGSQERKQLEQFWSNFLLAREKIWAQTNLTAKYCHKFLRFAVDTYRTMKYMGRKFGLKIQIEKSFFKFDYGGGLQLLQLSKKDIESVAPVQLQFQEKLTLHWHDFSQAPSEEQFQFLDDLLNEVAADLAHVETNFDFFIKELIHGKIYPKDVSFAKGLKQLHECIQYFLQSVSTSIAEYNRIQTFIKEFSLELMEFFNSIRHILLRVTAVCDVTELSAIYLSNKYEFLAKKLQPKFRERCCRKVKVYHYKEIDFIKTYYQQALLINTQLCTKHCNLTFRYSRDGPVSMTNVHSVPTLPTLSDAENVDNDAGDGTGVTGDNEAEETPNKIENQNDQDDIKASGSSSNQTQQQHTISIYSYLNSEEYKLKSILKTAAIR